jgi:hypothetical protein
MKLSGSEAINAAVSVRATNRPKTGSPANASLAPVGSKRFPFKWLSFFEKSASDMLTFRGV